MLRHTNVKPSKLFRTADFNISLSDSDKSIGYKISETIGNVNSKMKNFI